MSIKYTAEQIVKELLECAVQAHVAAWDKVVSSTKANKVAEKGYRIHKKIDDNFEIAEEVISVMSRVENPIIQNRAASLSVSFGINTDWAFKYYQLRIKDYRNLKNLESVEDKKVAIDSRRIIDLLKGKGFIQVAKKQKRLAKYDVEWLRKILG